MYYKYCGFVFCRLCYLYELRRYGLVHKSCLLRHSVFCSKVPSCSDCSVLKSLTQAHSANFFLIKSNPVSAQLVKLFTSKEDAGQSKTPGKPGKQGALHLLP